MIELSKLSFWEKEQYLENIDFLIIGAGIVGSSAALELRVKYPGSKIVILERSYLPLGASTKNAGFACFGSLTELVDDLSQNSEEQVWETVKMRYDGLKNLRKLIGDEDLDFQGNGSWDLIVSEENLEFYRSKIESLNANMFEFCGEKDVYSEDKTVSDQFNFDGILTSFKNRLEGQIDTGKMMLKFSKLLAENGILTLNGMEVLKFTENEKSNVVISTKLGEIFAKKVIVCVNGFAKQFLEEEVEPARAQVLITKPIPNLKIIGTFHYQMGYYYFRNINNRILFGGGRNLDFKGENTTSFENTELIKKDLETKLREIILPNTDFEIDCFWSGIMGVGQSKKPIIKKISPNVVAGVRMGGMGVAIGSLVGKKLAELV